jgi:hypothetical protein
MKEFELLKDLLLRTQGLRFNDNNELDDIRRKGKMALENLFPLKSYWIDIGNIAFEKFHYPSTPSFVYANDWKEGQNKLINLLDTAISDFEIQLSRKNLSPIPAESKIEVLEKVVPVIDESAVREIKQQFIEYRQAVRKWIYFFLFLSLISASLWLFYFYSNWEWFNKHPKKLGVMLLINLILIILLLNIPIKNKWAIWITTAFAVVATMFTII